jgi:cytochrome c1
MTEWRRLVTPALTAAELARDLVQSQAPTDGAERRASVNVQVDAAVRSLERAAASAPDETLAGVCARCAESLRGLAFAVEADHLMRSGGEHPTGAQLAAADAARRSRAAELETGLGELRAALRESR